MFLLNFALPENKRQVDLNNTFTANAFGIDANNALAKMIPFIIQVATNAKWKSKTLNENLKGAFWYLMLNVKSEYHLIALMV